MKQRSTTPVSKGLAAKGIIAAVTILALAVAPMQFTTTVSADQYDEQIRAIQKQIDQYQAQARQLSEKADTLQNKLAVLAKQKSIIQSQIDASEAERKKLEQQIVETEQKIADNRDALGETIADMYLSDTISPLEMLASSESIGDYVDKQEYRSEIRDNLTGTIDEIKQLKIKLEEQKVAVERTLLDQKNSRKALADKEAEQQTLLAETRNSESAYKKLTSKKQAEKRKVQEAQQAAIEAALAAAGGAVSISGGDGSMGGYPWAGGCYVGADALSRGGPNGNGEDPLGYGCRQCVSYTAFKMMQKTGYAPQWWGHANMWPNSARNAGFSTGSTPRANAIGIISAGQYGHAVYVEGYNASTGMVRISQFNYWNAGGPGWGHYSEMTVPAATYDTYIYM